uniref:PWWP domain-containing protein n=1 Tax=Chenopodium quinoa TaxID=63459 RepID=A0A803NET5_CHEQI
MQSDVVSKDPCSENAVSAELSGCVLETLVEEEGLRREKESEGMEVDNVGEHLNDKGEASSLKGELGSLNDACVEKKSKDLVTTEGVMNQENPIKANFNSFAQQLFPNPNPVDVGRRGKEVETRKSVENQSGEVKSQAATSDKKKGKNKGGFCASDIVWGKVKSHPWWPAQIFEPGDASEKARKHFKSKGYFVGYFGDQTFAWNDEAKLKPFAPNFSQMVVENDGIREQSRIREGGDRFYTAASFEPGQLLHYVKDLAQGPHGDVDRLEHVVARAQTAAFYRWKGIYHLAKFGLLIGYVNNEADAPVIAEKENPEGIVGGNFPPVTIKEDDNRPQKRKKTSNDSGHVTKKVRCLSDLIGKKSVKEEDGKGIKGKLGSKSISSSARRQKEVKSFPNDSTPSRTKESSPRGTTMQLKDTKPSFRVGESILRVAGQLSQSSPLLKLDVSSHTKTSKDEGNNKQCSKLTSEYASIDVILSELHLAAIEPLKQYSLLSKMVTFISVFRNSIVPDIELLQKHEKSGEEDTTDSPNEVLSGPGPAEIDAVGCISGTKSKPKASESEITTPSDVEGVEDACCTNRTIKEMESTVSSPPRHCGSENGTPEGGQFDVKKQLEDSPTALTLKFTDMDSIPTEAKLIKIFSHFGSLKESETEVLAKKLCARVVFKRRSDAETAFSSSGKFEIFGPSLVCYRLNYAPSPRKSPSIEAKRRRKD